jgi:hypothetical protein
MTANPFSSFVLRRSRSFEMQPGRATDPKPPGISIDAAEERGIEPDVDDRLAGFFGTVTARRLWLALAMKASALASTATAHPQVKKNPAGPNQGGNARLKEEDGAPS